MRGKNGQKAAGKKRVRMMKSGKTVKQTKRTMSASSKNSLGAAEGRRKRRISDKWAKTLVLWADRKLRKHIPMTKKLTKDSLRTMLRQYGMVYVKPARGSLGRGVMKAEMGGPGSGGSAKRSYAYQLGERKSAFLSYKAFYRSLLKDTKGERYIVQKGIRLLKHKGRPFDIRLVVQRAPRGGWAATGTVGRAAHPRKIVTNGSQGGSIYPTAYLLKKYASAGKRRLMLKRMDRLGIDTVKRLHRAYPWIVEIGLDLAIDRKLKPWILEVNTIPDPCPFTLLPDQSMLRRIIRYGKGYGKTYRLNCTKAKRGL
ncbi:YheC/YheD family protein [Paenibacillus alkaliterrae]|uniref:YheC/YheD family protein n=1 Tax=Paenibacillus alkaliterrae TaxID=320909 RepID=UPI001F2E90A7|nr:YheC/YheD family protein [Paenibacillus alkaliterrae]MCF2939731.1 YheC/YheD family protein [Paenibacillus alkaliterrae]